MNPEQRETSEWNGAGDYLDRINLSLIQAANASMTLDLYNWLHALKLFYRELSSVMKDDEKKALYEESVKLSEQINNHLTNKQYTRGRIRIGTPPQLVESLENFEIKLRKVFKESGLQLKLTDDASKALR